MALESEDRVISDFLRSLGPWSKHVIIGGGYALIIYKLYMSDPRLKNPPVGTRDIDSLIPRKLPEICGEDISTHLRAAGFAQVFKDLDHPATEAYYKEIEGFEIEVEFLTDSATRGDKHKNVVVAGVVAQPLSYLTLSLDKSMEFRTLSGETGLVVSPGAWMFHKGLTFTRRSDSSKVFKDLYGIWYVATQLGDLSTTAITELKILKLDHLKWSKTFGDNLRIWIESAPPVAWSNLEVQDPAGRLKRLNFDRIIKELIG